mmetsp:Transcript_27461/g.41754  ORF Transcript_27461/g.41754 Transcript_27461/m.41754 type:complete len:98 (+) Transcript_27461:961-1254(+)
MKRIIDFTMNLNKVLNTKDMRNTNKFRTIDPKTDPEKYQERTQQPDEKSRNCDLSVKEELQSSKPYRDHSLEDHLSSISQKQLPNAEYEYDLEQKSP